MAQKTILQMVYNRLPFLTVTEANSELIADFKQDVYYYLQPWTRITDELVEDDDTYTGLKRILVAEMTALNIVTRKVLIEMGGENGGAASGGKRLRKGKADVVEAEFEYAKASEGGAMITDMNSLLTELKTNRCNYARALGYSLPDCNNKLPVELPSFIAFVPEE